MNYATLSEVCDIVVGRTPPRKDPSMWGEGEPWLSIADMNQGLAIRRTKEQITRSAAASGRPVLPGTVLLSFKLSIGKVAISEIPLYTNEAIAALPIKDKTVLDERFLLRFLESAELTSGSNRAAMGATLNKSKLQNIQVPLPPLEEQRRIAAILDQADATRAKHLESVVQLAKMVEIVIETVLATNSLPMIPLGDLAQVNSGITKGRVTRAVTREVPYLAVANVQAGHLNLNNIKRIDATESEIEKFRLIKGDILMTEGGDPDKLGRGTIWRGEYEECIHQNHIFRARVDDPEKIRPLYLNYFLRSVAARSYFIRSAKQTTGIASINKTQLKKLPVQIPSITVQDELISKIQAIENVQDLLVRAIDRHDELFTSLQAQAFKGEL